MNLIDGLKFIESLPEVLSYLVQGFIFVSIYEFVNYKDENSNIQNLFFKSIIASFILRFIYDPILGNRIDGVWYNLVFTIFTLIVTIIIIRLTRFKWFKKLVQNLFKSNRNSKKYIWEDILDPDKNFEVYLTVYDEERKHFLTGMIHISEDFSKNPMVILKRYTIFNNDDNKTEVCNHNKSYTKRLVLDMSKYRYFQLDYDENSQVVADIKKQIQNENIKGKSSGFYP